MPAALTHTKYKEVLKNKYPLIKVVGTFSGVNTEIEHTCLLCNNTWSFKPHRVLYWKVVCPVCGKQDKRGPKIRSIKDVLRTFKSVHGTSYDYKDSVYVKYDIPIRINCKKHGNFYQTPYAHASGNGCPKCFQERRLKKLIKPIKDCLADVPNTIHTVGYVASSKKLQATCLVCGHEWTPYAGRIAGKGCPVCSFYTRGWKRKRVKRQGTVFSNLMGYEPQALDYILENNLASVKEIKIGKDVPRIKYSYRNTSKTYFPDMYIPTQNRIIEVKSIWTLIMSGYVFKQIKAKRQATVLDGFRFSLLVMDRRGDRVKLPPNWYEMTFSAMKNYLSTGVHVCTH